MIAALRAFLRAWRPRDATPAEDACETCPWQLAVHCTELQAATCQVRLVAVAETRRADCTPHE